MNELPPLVAPRLSELGGLGALEELNLGAGGARGADGAELDGVLNGDACANQENDRTFVVAWRAGGVVHAAGVVAERKATRPN